MLGFFRGKGKRKENKNENIIEEVTSYKKNDDNELYNKLNLLKLRKVEMKNDIKDVNGILKDNKKLIDYLEKLDIYVKISDDNSIKLSKENILNYNENQIFYEKYDLIASATCD